MTYNFIVDKQKKPRRMVYVSSFYDEKKILYAFDFFQVFILLTRLIAVNKEKIATFKTKIDTTIRPVYKIDTTLFFYYGH